MQIRHLFLILPVLTSLLGAACAPKKHVLQITNPPQDFKEKVADADVKSQGLFNMDFDQSVTVKNQTSPALIYRLSENMMVLGKSEDNAELSKNGQLMLQKVMDLPGLAVSTTADQSPYVQLAITETRKEVSQALTQVDTELAKDMTLLNQLLQNLGKTYPWPQQPVSLDQAGQAIAGFLGAFAQQTETLDLFDALKSQLKLEIAKQQDWVIQLTTKIQNALNTIKTFPQIMAFVQKTLVEEEITPTDDLKKTLGQGQQLAQDLSVCKDERAVLTTIVDVWTMLDDEQRIKYIKSESDALYEKLKNSNEHDLQCLRTNQCWNPLKGIVKQIILMKISKIGVEKLCTSIDQSALQYVNDSAKTQVSQLYAQLPSYVSTALQKAIDDKTKVLTGIRQNYAGFLKLQVQNWAASNLLAKGKVRGVDIGNLQLGLKQKELQLQAITGTATAEGTGASMSALTQAFQDSKMDQARVQQSSLDLVNQLVALGGYTTEYGTLAPALMTPLEPTAPILDLSKITTATAVYGLPDQFMVANNFQPRDIHPKPFSLSARSQAELIRGLANVISYLSDWRVSAYDSTLGSITAATLVPDYKDVAELQRSMFPKAELMTLAIGDLAVTLENLTKKMAQAFVVGLTDNKITFVNDYDLENGDVVAMAGVVDIKDGVRAQVVRSQDLARWILAMSDFLAATDGIENTKSEILLEKDNGSTALESLVKARHQLKLLTVAFSNLLSHQMIDKDGLVMAQLKLTDLGTEAGQKTLLDQAMAIQALNRAADTTGVSIYRVSAHEIYYQLNQKKYLAKMHFYSMSGQVEKLDLETLSETLRAISELKNSLPEKSKMQANWIIEPWLQGFAKIH